MRQKIVKAERPMIVHPNIFIQNLLNEWKVLRDIDPYLHQTLGSVRAYDKEFLSYVKEKKGWSVVKVRTSSHYVVFVDNEAKDTPVIQIEDGRITEIYLRSAAEIGQGQYENMVSTLLQWVMLGVCYDQV